ncbi:hypothetical protein A2Z00_02015 [Candidatus Gottesmanbacteria bacterium RBG_13_45_10]|uniref:Uncharacterized protein n=1 Tax=Candidatus Gottesmanbacteria bacterium RBG_13_45_10 TaxID=1798370 RepID=A0A1F5ZHI9_9BACT|nr:MAG: hypothetical protein A2Z00_02015 [Candidatus Gottesmanbacteria bacterium RBG_13_45_10]
MVFLALTNQKMNFAFRVTRASERRGEACRFEASSWLWLMKLYGEISVWTLTMQESRRADQQRREAAYLQSRPEITRNWYK